MKREIPVDHNAELDLYIRTYYSLLRSSGEVEVRAFEETHAYSASALHEGALDPKPDLAAFAYAAARLPEVIVETNRIILGQSHELFEAAGFAVRQWKAVKTRGRRRPLRYDGKGTLGVFIASASDIDDLVPIVTAYQIEWNKMHTRLASLRGKVSSRLPNEAKLGQLLGIDGQDVDKLASAFGKPEAFERGLRMMIERPLRLRIRMLAASYSQYQRAAQRWWSGIEPTYMRKEKPRRPPIYFVSSNTHAVANLVGGYARSHQKEIANWAKKANPEGLAQAIRDAEQSGDEGRLLPILYYLLRAYIHTPKENARMKEVRDFENEGGLTHLAEPGHIDVDAQIVELRNLDESLLDPRLAVPGIETLKKSRAIIINIDYPLGMAAYHLLSRVGQGAGEVRGVYVMGKAATLNGRVGDIMISNTVFDEHSNNTFLFRNAFSAEDVMPWLHHGSVFDSQRALTVRSAFLQNKRYMTDSYREGYTVLEMEAGPFLSATYELVYPTRVPQGEILHLSAHLPYDIGLLHYASDTPYSRRQSLLSKSLSFFGVDSTYACAIAIVRRILEQEIQHLAREQA